MRPVIVLLCIHDLDRFASLGKKRTQMNDVTFASWSNAIAFGSDQGFLEFYEIAVFTTDEY